MNFARNWNLTVRNGYIQDSVPGEWSTQISVVFWYTNGSANFDQTTKQSIIQEKKTCRIVHLTDMANHRVKLKESEKKKIGIWILLGNIKNCGTRKWQWCQL